MPEARRRRDGEWVVSPHVWKLQVGSAACFLLVFVLDVVEAEDRSLWTLGRLGLAIFFLIVARQSYQHRRR